MDSEKLQTDKPAPYWVAMGQGGLTIARRWISDGWSQTREHPQRSLIGLLIILILFFGAFSELDGGPDGYEFLPVAIFWPLLQIGPLLLLPWSVHLTWFLMAITVIIAPLNARSDYFYESPYWLWTASALIAYVAVLLLVGASSDLHIIGLVGAGNVLALMAPLLLFDDGTLWYSIPITVAALAAGYYAARRTEILAAAQREQAAQNRVVAEEAAATERARIARELHDVIAHHMSMIAIQAEAAPYKDPDLAAVTRQSFSAIRSSSTTALIEMRRVIGMLRPEDEEIELAPQPSIASIPALVDGVRAAGSEITLRMIGIEPNRPPAVDLSVYRLVQEGLSNAVRHAPGAAVTIEIIGSAADVRLLILNGSGHNNGRSDKPTKIAPSTPGHGLLGMRERVSLLGGEIVAQPSADGGFSLLATLPWNGEPPVPRASQ